MSRPVIPPLPPPSTQAQPQQSEVLRRRLASAEEDARQILSQLGNFGQPVQTQLNPNSNPQARERTSSTGDRVLAGRPPHPHPSGGQMVEPKPSSFSQDALISRVCKLESMLQTLKVGLAGTSGTFTGGVDKKRLRAEVEERVGAVKQELGTEVVRLRRQMASLQEELTIESEARQRLKQESDKLKEVLEEATKARAEAAAAVEEMSNTKQKLIGRINDLKEEVARETSLRASLEASHSTLMSRVHETETLVEKERTEMKTVSSNTSTLRQEVVRLKEELSAESSRRQMAEESCQRLIAEKEKSQSTFHAAQSDCQLASSELSRLQCQYTELIHQFEQTQKVVEQQRAHLQEVETERDSLRQVVDKVDAEQHQAEKFQKLLNEAEESHRLVRGDLEEEMSALRTKVTDLTTHNTSLQSKVRQLQTELEFSQNSLASRDRDFSSAATGLETELNNVRRQLQSLESEKESVLQGKENLLEEVNQTVDSLMAERARLQGELDKVRGEVEGLRGKLRQTEAENMQFIERLGGFEHQQMTQRKVETTLQDMVEQKNKLAYDNGRLQSQAAQLTQDLATAQAQCTDTAHLRKVNEAAQTKLMQVQREAGDYKMAARKLEGKLQHTSDLLEQKQHELQLTLARREEVESEMGKMLGRIEVLESREKNKAKQHQKNMDDAKSVNREIASTLEAVMQSHTQLQELVENLQGELGRRDAETGRLKNLRVQDQDNSKLELQQMAEMIEALRQELKKEHDKSGRKTNRDIAELKKLNNNLSARNGELVATNTELRQRVGEMERTIGELQHKVSAQKHKADYMYKAKKHVEENLERIKQMREDIDELERLRDEYMQKNKEQAETITMFMQQMTSLQDEVQQLAAAQINTGRLLQMKEEALDKERKLREDLKKRYSETKKREDHVSKQKHVADDKLKEAHNESVEISKNLMDAHEWFKGKFEKLQDELADSRAAQAKLQEVNTYQQQQLLVEKSHAQQAAERAKEMIKASRQTIGKLADYTEQADYDTKRQLADLRAEMAREKVRASHIEDNYRGLKDAVVKVPTSNVKRNSHR
ncbi:coiled-coil domain-containing protein 150-like isoform X2 [Littorina saxatilis]|uniref:Uncharacterized protein n=1 Tax=Littorina saxatilis TaxID=31220 RepID=A0AAN9G3L8_9CAEN